MIMIMSSERKQQPTSVCSGLALNKACDLGANDLSGFAALTAEFRVAVLQFESYHF